MRRVRLRQRRFSGCLYRQRARKQPVRSRLRTGILAARHLRGDLEGRRGDERLFHGPIRPDAGPGMVLWRSRKEPAVSQPTGPVFCRSGPPHGRGARRRLARRRDGRPRRGRSSGPSRDHVRGLAAGDANIARVKKHAGRRRKLDRFSLARRARSVADGRARHAELLRRNHNTTDRDRRFLPFPAREHGAFRPGPRGEGGPCGNPVGQRPEIDATRTRGEPIPRHPRSGGKWDSTAVGKFKWKGDFIIVGKVSSANIDRAGARVIMEIIATIESTLVAAIGATVTVTTAMAAETGGAGAAKPGEITFNRDLAPVIFSHCAPCHRPGGAGPFSLLRFAEARKRAREMAKVTAQRIMPPWLSATDQEWLDSRRMHDA